MSRGWSIPPADATAHFARRLAVETDVSDMRKGPLPPTDAAGPRVREMIGGFEYWAREGLAVETAHGTTRPDVDPLTAPAASAAAADAQSTAEQSRSGRLCWAQVVSCSSTGVSAVPASVSW